MATYTRPKRRTGKHTHAGAKSGKYEKREAATTATVAWILKPDVPAQDLPNAPTAVEVKAAATLIRARKELLKSQERRLIFQALKAKTSQETIASLLGVSQATISRVAKQIARDLRDDPDTLLLKPSEVINQRASGEIDTESMMEALLAYRYTPGSYDPTGGDGFVRGDWRQIEDALSSGLITDEEYETIARQTGDEAAHP